MEHREKLSESASPFSECVRVARLVGKAECAGTSDTREAMLKAWARLRTQQVWGQAHPRAWSTFWWRPSHERLLPIWGTVSGTGMCLNLAQEALYRKYEGLVVFQSIDLCASTLIMPICQDLASSLATPQGAKAADVYGRLPGHVVEIVDVEQGRVQAGAQGIPTWERLPTENLFDFGAHAHL